MGPCVYILKSLKNGRYYIGSTTNLERRLWEHANARSKYTSQTGPYEFLFSQKYNTIIEAKRAERWIKLQKDKDFIQRLLLGGLLRKNFKV